MIANLQKYEVDNVGGFICDYTAYLFTYFTGSSGYYFKIFPADSLKE